MNKLLKIEEGWHRCYPSILSSSSKKTGILFMKIDSGSRSMLGQCRRFADYSLLMAIVRDLAMRSHQFIHLLYESSTNHRRSEVLSRPSNVLEWLMTHWRMSWWVLAKAAACYVVFSMVVVRWDLWEERRTEVWLLVWTRRQSGKSCW